MPPIVGKMNYEEELFEMVWSCLVKGFKCIGQKELFDVSWSQAVQKL